MIESGKVGEIMEKERKTRAISLAALVIGVVALSVGFAAFARNLKITSTASYNPTSSDLTVDFSTEKTSAKAGTITPTGEAATGTVTLTESGGAIATVNNLTAKFTNKGQSATYKFFIYNGSDYTAYLKSATMKDVETGKKIKCTAGTGTNATMVETACGDISLSVKVGDELTEIFKTPTTFATHSIEKKTGVPVEVTISYAGETTVPDGDFTVEFGELTLSYSSAQ